MAVSRVPSFANASDVTILLMGMNFG